MDAHSALIMSAMASQITGVSIVCLTLQIKDNIKAPRRGPLWGESTSNRWIPITKSQCGGNASIWWRHRVKKMLPLERCRQCQRLAANRHIDGQTYGEKNDNHHNSFGPKGIVINDTFNSMRPNLTSSIMRHIYWWCTWCKRWINLRQRIYICNSIISQFNAGRADIKITVTS